MSPRSLFFASPTTAVSHMVFPIYQGNIRTLRFHFSPDVSHGGLQLCLFSRRKRCIYIYTVPSARESYHRRSSSRVVFLSPFTRSSHMSLEFDIIFAGGAYSLCLLALYSRNARRNDRVYHRRAFNCCRPLSQGPPRREWPALARRP